MFSDNDQNHIEVSEEATKLLSLKESTIEIDIKNDVIELENSADSRELEFEEYREAIEKHAARTKKTMSTEEWERIVDGM